MDGNASATAALAIYESCEDNRAALVRDQLKMWLGEDQQGKLHRH